MTLWIKTYLAALLVIGALDALWLGWLAKDFYRAEMGPVMVDTVRKLPAALFYFAYPAALVTLVFYPAPGGFGAQVAKAALVGAVAYGVYDLTNLATLKHWPVKLALVDMAWGVVVSAAGGAAAAWLRARM
jgi:uncharacterized membrane protein